MPDTHAVFFKWFRGALLALALLLCRGVDGQSLTLEWNPSTGTQPAGYLVLYGTDNTNFTDQYDAGTNTGAILTDVEPGLLYYFEVVAYDTNGVQSAPSTEISYTIPVITWTVAASPSPASAGSVIGGGVYADGSEVTVSAAPKSGYLFANWTANGVVQSASPSYTFSVSANQDLVANFTPKTITYTVSAASGNNGSVTPSAPQTVNAGATLGFTATPNSGYQVGQWLVNGAVAQTGGSAFTLLDVSANCVVSVNFTTDPTVSVAVSPSGAGTITGGGPYPTGTSVALTATANRGYTFTNWTENGIIQSASPAYNFAASGDRNLVANFTVNPIVYTVTAASGGNGSVTPPGPLPLTAGKGVTFFATPVSGYQVNQWLIAGVLAQSGGASLTLQSISSNTVVTVTFQAEPTVALAVNPPSAGTVNGAGAYASGSQVTVTAAAISGFAFTNWTVNGAVKSSSPSYTFTISSSRSLVANFAIVPIFYTVTVNAGTNGVISPSARQTVQAGASVTYSAAPASGYQVNQWLVNGAVAQSGGSAFTLQNVSANSTVSVNFSVIPPVYYTVSAVAGANGTITPNGVHVVQAGANVAFTATPNNGYAVNQWLLNGNLAQTGGAAFSLSSVNTNANVQVTFSAVAAPTAVVDLTASPIKGGSVVGGGSFAVGTSVTVTATQNAGYAFTNWTENGIVQSPFPSYKFALSGDRNLVANFVLAPVYYTVTASAAANGSITPSGAQSVVAGGSASYTAKPASGFQIGQWLVDGGSVQTGGTNFVIQDVSNNITVAVTFNLIPPSTFSVSVDASPTNGGSVSGGGTFDVGSSVTVTAVASNGFAFTNWTENGVLKCVTTNYTFTLSANHNLVANFVPVPVYYTVKASAGTNGSVSPSTTQSVLAGGLLTLEALPASGYQVGTWTVGGVAAQTGGLTLTLDDISSNTAVKVSFTQIAAQKFAVVASANPTNGGFVMGGGSYVGGSLVTLMATATNGYTFTNWTEYGQAVSVLSNYTFTVSGNRNLVANFVLAPVYYTVAASAETHGSVSPNGPQNALQGAAVTFVATPASGYQVGQWILQGVPINGVGSTLTLQDVSTNITVDVTFNAIPPSTFTVQVGASPTNGGAAHGAGTFNAGSSVTVTAAASKGFTFTNWSESGIVKCVTTNYTFTLGANRNLVANFVPLPVFYTVTPSAGANGSVSPSATQSVLAGGALTLTAAPNRGYQVNQWLVGGVSAQVGGLTFTLQNVASNTAVEATFSAIPPQTFTVAASASPTNGGAVFGEGTFNAGSPVTVTAVASSGFAFTNWTEDGVVLSVTTNFAFTLNANRNLMANFVPVPVYYTVTANAAANGSVSPSTAQSVLAGGTTTLTATPNKGYQVDQWLVGGIPSQTVGTTLTLQNISNNAAVEVTFSAIAAQTFTVAASASPTNGGAVQGDGTYNAGSSVTVTAVASYGFAFTNWTEGGVVQGVTTNFVFVLNANRNLVANFVPVYYTLSASAGANGSVSPSAPQSVLAGGTMVLTATPNKGYQVDQWLVGGVAAQTGGLTLTLENIASNTAVVVSFSAIPPQTFTIAASSAPTNGGFVTGSGTFVAGTSATITATATNGYTFSNWTENGQAVSASSNYTFTVNGNRNLVAQFVAPVYFTVTAGAGDNGSVSPSGAQSVLQGAAMTFVATPASGYKIDQWIVQGVPISGGGSTFTIQDVSTNITVEVTFAQIPPTSYTVGLTANAAGEGSVSGAGTFAVGAAVTVTATPNAGYAFTNWTENGVVQSAASSYAFTLNTNRNLVANFVGLPTYYTVTATAGPNGMLAPSGAVSVVQGGTAMFAAAPADGFKVDQWLVNGSVWETGGTAFSLQNVNGNLSLTVTFTAISPSATNSTTNISFAVSGQGSLTPYRKGTVFKVGKKYPITATPAKGYLFANWVSNGVVVATKKSYTFSAQNHLSLEAVFVKNPFIAIQGAYKGLFYDTNWTTAESSGSIAISVTGMGGYTAHLNVGGKGYTQVGNFTLDGGTTITIPRGKLTPVTAALQLDLGSGPLAGTVSDGTWISQLTADAPTTGAPQAGQYTLAMPGSADPSVAPGGDGFASVTVNNSGAVMVSGLLGDGTPFSLTTAVNAEGEAPFYVSLNGGAETMFGWLSFSSGGEIGGQLAWFKSSMPKAKMYGGGFATLALVVGSPYRVVKGTPPFNVTGDFLTLSGGDLVQPFTAPTGLDAQIQGAKPGTDKLTFLPNTGFFKASVINSLTAKSYNVVGVVLQDQNYGAGLFLGADETGGVYLNPGQ